MPDVVMGPWAVRLWVFDHFKGGLGAPEPGQGGEDEQLWERWRKWAKAVEQRDSVKNTLSEKEYYLPLYERVSFVITCVYPFWVRTFLADRNPIVS